MPVIAVPLTLGELVLATSVTAATRDGVPDVTCLIFGLGVVPVQRSFPTRRSSDLVLPALRAQTPMRYAPACVGVQMTLVDVDQVCRTVHVCQSLVVSSDL